MNETIRRMREQGIKYEQAVLLFRRQFVLSVLRECGGNQCLAASALGVHRNTLGRHLIELEVTDEELKQLRRRTTEAA